MNVIFFDTETNGTDAQSSVLQVSAIRAVFNGHDVDTVKSVFSRFYFRREGEPENPGAIAVNGLTEDVIIQKRDQNGEAPYSRWFTCDSDWDRFCEGVRHFVAHNIDFDKKFLNFKPVHTFCTMRENTNFVKAPGGKYGQYKWPKLMETAVKYGIELDPALLHDSDYDTLILYRVFQAMLKAPHSRDKCLDWLRRE
jgi:DNA polymerase-3 subunit epsilon